MKRARELVMKKKRNQKEAKNIKERQNAERNHRYVGCFEKNGEIEQNIFVKKKEEKNYQQRKKNKEWKEEK